MHYIIAALLVVSVVTPFARCDLFLHKGERFDYDISQVCAKDNCTLLEFKSKPTLENVTVMQKAELRELELPRGFEGYDEHSASVIMSMATNDVYLVLQYNNRTYAIASLTNYRISSTLQFIVYPIETPAAHYNCTSLQRNSNNDFYEALCLYVDPSDNHTRIFFIECIISGEPICYTMSRYAEAELMPNSRYHLRVCRDPVYDDRVIFNRSSPEANGVMMVVTAHKDAKPPVVIKDLYDVIYTVQDSGMARVIAAGQGLQYVPANTDQMNWTEALGTGTVVSLTAKDSFKRRTDKVYFFVPKTCEVQRLVVNASKKHAKQDRLFAPAESSCCLEFSDTPGSSLVKLTDFVVALAYNKSKGSLTLLAYRLSETDRKFIYSSVDLGNLSHPRLYPLNQRLNAALVMADRRLLFWSLRKLKVVVRIPDLPLTEMYQWTLVFGRSKDEGNRRLVLNVTVLNQTGPKLMQHNDRQWYGQGWNDENNMHRAFDQFSGTNVSLACPDSYDYTCDVTPKIKKLQAFQTNWDLKLTESIYLLSYLLHACHIILRKFSLTFLPL